MTNELLTLASEIESAMPRDWLTPDLRFQVALSVAEAVIEHPWTIDPG